MKKIRDVSNEEFEMSLKDINATKIKQAALKPYRKSIDSNELEQISRIAHWKALSTYSGKKGCSFLNYLFKYVRWECKMHFRKLVKNTLYVPEIEASLKDDTSIADCLMSLGDTERKLVEYRFIHNMTYSEIAKEMSTNRETARKKLNKILKKLKTYYK